MTLTVTPRRGCGHPLGGLITRSGIIWSLTYALIGTVSGRGRCHGEKSRLFIRSHSNQLTHDAVLLRGMREEAFGLLREALRREAVFNPEQLIRVETDKFARRLHRVLVDEAVQRADS